MGQETERHDITKKRAVYQMPGEPAVTVLRDVEYRVTDGGALKMDIYYPPDSTSAARIPAVIFVIGYPDPGAQKLFGCKFKEMECYVSWSRLTAASGLAAVTYTTGNEPAADIHALIQYIRSHAAELRIDENRIGLWSCSGSVPNALSILMQETGDYLKCAVLCYGLMLDLEGATGVADAARQWGFVNPCAGKSVADLPEDVPLFVVRAGHDETPHLNETMDRFMSNALSFNLPITFVNYPAAPHAFDLMYDTENSREIIRQILAFMRFHLSAAG